METMTAERVIDAPIDEVFAWLTTTTHYTRSPLVLRCRLSRRGKDAPYGVGAVRSHLWMIGWLRERITRYEAPYTTEYVVERSVPPSRHEFGSMTFTEVDGGTRVTWTTRAEMAMPVVGPFLTRAVVRPMIIRSFDSILGAAESALTRHPRAERKATGRRRPA
ncbi:SRPBCC family protein [Streptomyces sp. NPDC048361]|uniref:SRPBCC family protein n=1 Tax=Streptomyces sp. NPDC048361 TaxID=3154720 RepID=UPI00343F942A